MAGQNPDLAPLMAFINETFPSAKVIEQHHNMLQYQLGAKETQLARIFGQLEMVRSTFHIEDYSVSQTTLDQVSHCHQHYILFVMFYKEKLLVTS